MPRNEHNQPASGGRLTHQFGRPDLAKDAVALSRQPCHISVEYVEDGSLKVEISGRVEYAKGAFVGASFSSADDDIPAPILNELRAMLSEILDEAHDALKARLDGEVKLAMAVHPKDEG